MMSMWLGQIAAVIRLEMKKTFLSKRGLWVYLLALAPVSITTIHSLVEMSQGENRRAMAAAHPIDSALLQSIQPGMSQVEVYDRLGEPHNKWQFRQRNRDSGSYQYTDGADMYTYNFAGGTVRSIGRETRDTI